jgi:cytochrome b561
MSIGILILGLILLRLAVRLATRKPPQADIGHAVINRLGGWTHYAFYLVVILVCASGLATAFQAGVPGIVFGGSGEPLPADFSAIAPRAAHCALTALLILLIAGHVLAFLYHQYVRRDGLFSRMWFGHRTDS